MLWTERLESLKAGSLSALATGFTALSFCSLEYGVDRWSDGALWSEREIWAGVMAQFAPSMSSWELLVRLAIALMSGFLFGVTYRYIIRQDDSTHLRSGAVFAFALVRGLARLDQRGLGSPLREWQQLQEEMLIVLLLLGESWVMFAVARWLLDLSLSRGWLQSFQS